MRPLPLRSSAVSATSILNAPLTAPSARPIAEVAPGTAEIDGRRGRVVRGRTARRSARWSAPVRPPSVPLFGNARPVVLPIAGRRAAVEAPLNADGAWQIRAWSARRALRLPPAAPDGRARRAVPTRSASRSGRSVMMMVLVRASTWIWPRCDSADLHQQRRQVASLRVAERERLHSQVPGEGFRFGQFSPLAFLFGEHRQAARSGRSCLRRRSPACALRSSVSNA